MKMETRMPVCPGLKASRVVDSVVVRDQLQIQLRRRLEIDRVEEADKLLMSMPRHAVTDDPAVERDQRRKQRRRTVVFVIVDPGAATALHQGQSGLRAIQSVNLRSLVDARHKRLVRGIKVQPDNVIQLLDELPIAAQLEGFGHVWLEIVLLPDWSDRGFAPPVSLSHQSSAPVSRIVRLAVQRGFDDVAGSSVRDSRNASGPRGVFLKPRRVESQKTLLPQLHSCPQHTQNSRDFLILRSAAGHSENLRPPDIARWHCPTAGPSTQSVGFGHRKYDGSCCSAHYNRHARRKHLSQVIYDQLH